MKINAAPVDLVIFYVLSLCVREDIPVILNNVTVLTMISLMQKN